MYYNGINKNYSINLRSYYQWVMGATMTFKSDFIVAVKGNDGFGGP